MVLFCIIVGMTAPVALAGFLLGALLTSSDLRSPDAASPARRIGALSR